MLGAGNTVSARSIVLKALKDDPDNSSALILLVQIAVAEKSLDEALSITAELSSKDPRHASARFWEVEALILLERKSEPTQKLAAFERDFPLDREAMASLRLIFEKKLGSAKGMRKEVERLRKLTPDNPQLDALNAQALFKQARFCAALTQAKSALAKQPDNGSAHLMAALSAFYLLKFATARHHAAAIIKIEPRLAEPMRRLTQLSYLGYIPLLTPCHLLTTAMRIARARLRPVDLGGQY